jgi:hypothetical protein
MIYILKKILLIFFLFRNILIFFFLIDYEFFILLSLIFEFILFSIDYFIELIIFYYFYVIESYKKFKNYDILAEYKFKTIIYSRCFFYKKRHPLILYVNFINNIFFFKLQKVNKNFNFFNFILFLLNKSKIKINFFKFSKFLENRLLYNCQKRLFNFKQTFKFKSIFKNLLWNKKIIKLILEWELLDFKNFNIKVYFNFMLDILNINLKDNFFFCNNKNLFLILELYKFNKDKYIINNKQIINDINLIFLKSLSRFMYTRIKFKFYFILLLYNLFQFQSLNYFYMVNLKINNFYLKNKYIQIKNLNIDFFKYLII